MKDFNLLESLERAEDEFFPKYLNPVFDKLKAARRALILILMLTNPIELDEKSGKPFDDVEQAYIELAAATFTTGRSAFLLVLKGYLLQVQILLRALWEQVVFMEYFRLYPDECRTWVDAGNSKTARSPGAIKAWNAIQAKAQDTVLKGKMNLAYEHLTKYAHSHRHALYDLTIGIDEATSATTFGPAYEPDNLGLILELMVDLLISAVTVLAKKFEGRIQGQGSDLGAIESISVEILELAFKEPSWGE